MYGLQCLNHLKIIGIINQFDTKPNYNVQMQSVYIHMRIHRYKCEVPTAVSTTVSGYVPYKTSSGDKRRIHLQLLYASVYMCVYIRRAFSTHTYVHILIMGSSVYTSCTT